jgi:hypothetical protein
MSESIIHIARDGVVIDKQSLNVVIKLFNTQKFKPTDHYWMSGMSEWGSLKDLVEKTNKQSQIAEAKKSIPAWMVPPKHIPSNFGDEPATKKQKDYLLTFGVNLPDNLTKYDASRWLDLLTNNKEARLKQHEVELRNMSDRWENNTKDGKHYDTGFKTFSGYYRSEYNAYKKDGDLADAKEMKKHRIDAWHELIKFSMDSPWDEVLYQSEDFLCHLDALEVLYSYAKDFKVCPSKKVISETLIELDSESPTWDDDIPELLLKRLAEKMA